jgi:hypothetical protein
MRDAVLSTGLGIVGGGLVTIAVTVLVEWLRQPRLDMRIAAPVEIGYRPGQPAARGTYLHVHLVNRALPYLLRWLARASAVRCRGTLTFYKLDGKPLFPSPMPVRFSKSPEPLALQLSVGGVPGVLVDPQRLSPESRTDVHAGDAEPFDVAAKFDEEASCYGWSNLNYFCRPVWRHPEWRIPPGTYEVEVTIESSGARCTRRFRLLNLVQPNVFEVQQL